jgi:hypothetical protein
VSLRQILWLLVVLCVLVAAWQFVRALIVTRRNPPREAGAVASMGGGGGSGGDDGGEDEDFDYAPALRQRPAAPAPAASGEAGQAGAAPSPEAFQLELETRRLQRELAGMQTFVARQHAEIGALQLEIASLRAQLEEAATGASSVSPEYSESLRLAGQGMTADEIAARCGITVAEAELVLSLSRSGSVP